MLEPYGLQGIAIKEQEFSIGKGGLKGIKFVYFPKTGASFGTEMILVLGI